ncbi:YncE family protein [Streptomyces sp. JL4002]|uniref:YncE family protein n=1 Tax=Streptomyces sp. JL4002 TaxID=3404781 RepID=UPI003B285E1A
MTRNRDVCRRAAAALAVTLALTGLPDRPQAHAATGPAVTGPAVRPDRAAPGRVYVANLHSDTVSVVDPRTGTVTDTVPVGDTPNGLAVAPDGSRVHVADFGSDTLSVIDTRTATTLRTVPVGSGPTGVATTPHP